MAEFPIAYSGVVPQPTELATIDPSIARTGEEAIGRAVEGLGGALAGIDEKNTRIKANREYTEAQVLLMKADADYLDQLDNEPIPEDLQIRELA